MAETPCFRVLAHGHSTGEDTRMLGIHPEAKFSESTRKMALAFLFTQKLLSSQRHRDRLSSLILYDRIGVPCLHFPHGTKKGAWQVHIGKLYLNHRCFQYAESQKKTWKVGLVLHPSFHNYYFSPSTHQKHRRLKSQGETHPGLLSHCLLPMAPKVIHDSWCDHPLFIQKCINMH